MAEPVRAGALPQIEALGDRVRQADIFEHLDALAKAENAEPGPMPGEPGKGRLRVSSDENVPVETDGELIGNCPVEFQIRSGGLRVLAPL